MPQRESETGLLIAQRYRLTSKLGQGGMGSVWRAEHLALGSEVAVKLIDPSVAQHPEVRARFVGEAQAAAQLRSPHVVQILDYGVDDDTPFIVMELMDGESLADRLQRIGRLGARDTARIITEVARALAKAHEANIVHRDLKPDNVFLVKNDDVEIAKVLDFGVAKRTALGMDAARMTSTGAVLGTPYYMSPEQAEGLKDLDHRTDIWALAVIAYECILGTRPFDGETLGGLFLAICARPKPIPSLVGDVPDGFDAWFDKGTARAPADRFASAREAAQALRELCEAGQESPRQSNAGAPLASPRDSAGSLLDAAQTEASPHLGLSTAGVGAISVPLRARTPKRSGATLIAAFGGAALLAGGWALLRTEEAASTSAGEPPAAAVSGAAPASDEQTTPVDPREDHAAPAPSTSASPSAIAPEVPPTPSTAPAARPASPSSTPRARSERSSAPLAGSPTSAPSANPPSPPPERPKTTSPPRPSAPPARTTPVDLGI